MGPTRNERISLIFSRIKLDLCEKLYFNQRIDNIWRKTASQAGKEAGMSILRRRWGPEVLQLSGKKSGSFYHT